MKSTFAHFLGQFAIFALIVAGLAAYPLYKFADAVIMEGAIANLLLFFFLTVASFWLITRAKNIDTTSILYRFLAGTGIKMLISLVYFVVFMKSYPGRELDFALTFFAAYLVCTSFEVYYLLHNLRQN